MKLGCLVDHRQTDRQFMCSEIVAAYSDSRVRFLRFGGWHGLER